MWSEAYYFYLIGNWKEQASSARLSRSLWTRDYSPLVSCALSKHTVSLPPIIIKVIPQTDQKLSIEKGHFSFLFRQTMSSGRLGKMLYNEIMKPAI